MHDFEMMRRQCAAAIAIAATAIWEAPSDAKRWSDWSAPVSIETLAGSSSAINTPAVDGCARLSPDGLDLYFTSNRPGGLGGTDIWVAGRSSKDEGFGAPRNLGAPVNGPTNEACPTPAPGGRLYFTSFRTDPAGDLYIARQRQDGWDVEWLGPNVNSAGAIDESASPFEDGDGRQVLYFSSAREGRNRVYSSVDGGPAFLVAGGVNSSAADSRPTVSKDGLEIFWDSTRFGTLGGFDFWTATRSSTAEPWGTAVHLPALSSAGPGGFFQPGFDARPSLSWDGSTLVFGSFRSGGEGVVDLYWSTREKLTGKP